ncbi:MAG: hypothetical protein QT01_C0006G0030 [archaeon GW2011_AR6]|nr:MAG: hypothetical protein QT01_C0006G0030 [archaeon GW2011_AR6]
MHCAACEVLVERKFKKVPGVEKVSVDYKRGKAQLEGTSEPSITELNDALKEHGYSVSSVQHSDEGKNSGSERKEGSKYLMLRKEHIEVGAIFLLVVAAYLILKQFNLIPNIGISDNMTYGLAFLIGIVAAFSTCLAVTGGLLVSVANKHAEAHPNLTGAQKFRPHIYFNIGRVVSYTLLGGLLGIIGSKLILSAQISGIVTILAAAVMIILGLQLLNIFSWTRYLMPRMPKFLAHKIHDHQDGKDGKDGKAAPAVLGALTFFLPCGFTQALQLYVLSKGDFTTGALTMFFFSLGTLPGLMSLGAVSSYSKGKFHKYFVKVSAVVVILLGIFSLVSGLTLTGINLSVLNLKNGNGLPSGIELVEDKQVAEMSVQGLDYSPSKFTVKKGIPVEWRIDGKGARGCAQVISVPSLGITKYLSRDNVNIIEFTPKKTGKIWFSCSMGMAGPGYFEVVK